MLFQYLPESLLDRQVRFWLVLSLKTLALRRSTERRHRIYTIAEHKIPCCVERKEHQPPTKYHQYQRTLSYTLHTVVWGRWIDSTAPDAALVGDYSIVCATLRD